MNTNTGSSRWIIIIAVIVVLMGGAGFAIWVSTHKSAVDTGTAIGPSASKLPIEPIIGGPRNLIDQGLTSQQANGLNLSLVKFAKWNIPPFNLVQIQINTLTSAPQDPNTTHSIFYFDILVDQKATYKGTLDYWDLSTVRLTVTDPGTRKAVFDSGIVTAPDTSKN